MKPAVIALAVVVVGGLGVLLFNSQDDDSTDNTPTAANQSSTTERSDSQDSLEQTEFTPGGEIVAYDAAQLASSDAETNILFFHAAWCSICNAVERNLEAGAIPEGVRIHKVDFESSEGQDLADKYNIPIQYSMVQVNTDGEEITQWVNQSFFTIEDIIERIQTT